MSTKNYSVCREKVYVGQVVKLVRIHNRHNVYPNGPFFKVNGDGSLRLRLYKICRSQLFTLNDNDYSVDLLYDAPNYPILNITDEDACLELTEGHLLVHGAMNLGELLKYIGYGENLEYSDILRIRKVLFNGNFAKDNCEIFGRKEMMPEDYEFYDYGQKITDPKEIAKRRKEIEKERLRGQRHFVKTSEVGIFDDYWYNLDSFGNNSIKDFITGNSDTINTFKPRIEDEGFIRKLRIK